MFEVIDTVQA